MCVEQALADRTHTERVLVLVDQLEEAFTLCHDEVERRQLLASLLYASSAPGGRVVVIVTMRADFYGHCARYPEFAQVITSEQMLVGPMDFRGLRQAIEEPARRVGLEFEQGLVDTILGEVGAEPGALPLLEHSLLELWERRRGSLLTLEGYREAGGVHGALAQRAETIFGELRPEQQQIARRMLLRLTQPGDSTEDTRRRAPRAELQSTGSGAEVDDVLGRLVEARLLTAGRDETGLEIVDVSHEALIRGWPRLQGWIDADREGLRTHRRLTDAAREWDVLDREPAALYSGARLAAAHEWSAGHDNELSHLEHDFLAISETTELERNETTRRRTRRLRASASASVTLMVIVATLGIWALDLWSQSRAQRRQATSLTLRLPSVGLLQSRPDIALLLNAEAFRADGSVESRRSVVTALEAARPAGTLAILRGHTGAVDDVAFSPDGRMLASAGGADGQIRLWSAVTHRQHGAPMTAHRGAVSALAFTSDGQTLASSGQSDHPIRLWNVRSTQPRGDLPDDADHSVTWPVSLAITSAGRVLATGSDDVLLRSWDLRTRRRLLPVRMPMPREDQWFRVAFSPGGQVLAASTDDMIQFWDVRRGRRLGPPIVSHSRAVVTMAFSPDGRTLASAGRDRTVRLWDASRHTQVGRRAIPRSCGWA